MSFKLSLVTEYHQVHPKWFLSLRYVWRKPCTCLAPTLTPSPTGLKWDSTRPTSPEVPSGAFKMISEPMLCSVQTVHRFVSKLALSLNRPKWASSWASSMCQKRFLSLRYVWRKLCTYLATTLTPSTNRSKRDSRWPTSPRSTVGRVQKDFWSYGTFLANRAPILHRQ
jgi:hypothetical protein